MGKETRKREDRDAAIYDLWNIKKLSYSQISTCPVPAGLSLKRIRNIIYGGKHKLTTVHQKDVYALFRLKFLELQDVNAAIWYVYENQPEVLVPEITVRRIINRKLKSKNHEI